MVEILAEAHVQNILSDFPSHPKTDRIRYMPNDPALIVPLVQQRWIDAAIIPASAELKAQLLNPINAAQPSDISQCSVALKSRVSIDLPENLSDTVREHMRGTQAFIRAAGYDDQSIRSFMLVYQPGGNRSFEPCLHTDLTLNSYTAVFGAPMEFYAGDFPRQYLGGLVLGCETWEEQKEFIRDKGICDDIEQHLEAVGIGDIVVFGPHFVHRSARAVTNSLNQKGQGLVGYALNPMEDHHPLFG